MTSSEILTSLKKLGKPVTAAIYKRHGAGDNVYGVLTSEISSSPRADGLRARAIATTSLS